MTDLVGAAMIYVIIGCAKFHGNYNKEKSVLHSIVCCIEILVSTVTLSCDGTLALFQQH